MLDQDKADKCDINVSELLVQGFPAFEIESLEQFITFNIQTTNFEPLSHPLSIKECVHLKANPEVGTKVTISEWESTPELGRVKTLTGEWRPVHAKTGPGETIVAMTTKTNRRLFVWLDAMARIVHVKWDIGKNRIAHLQPYKGDNYAD